MKNNQGELYKERPVKHTGSRFLRLKKTDHAIVFRGQGSDLTVELYLGYDNKKAELPKEGGLLVTTLATNIFNQDFLDTITNQMTGLGKGSDNDV